MASTEAPLRREVGEVPAESDASWNDLYRAGAISAAACVAFYLVALVVVVATPAPPTSGGAATLQYISAHRSLHILEQVLWLAPSLFAIVVFLALYPALTAVNKSYAAIASVVGVAAWAISIAYPATGGGAPALVYLSDRYAAAVSVAERTAFVAAAEGFIAQNTIPMAIGVMQTIGVLLVSLLMVRSTFPRGVAYLGIATGAIGILSESLRPVLGGAYAIYGLLILLWFAAMAWQLGALGRRSRDDIPVTDRRGDTGHGTR